MATNNEQNPIESLISQARQAVQQYLPPSQIQASNPDDAKVLHLAQTLYGEFAGVKDPDKQRSYMVMGASAAHNLYQKREYKDLDWDTYLYKRFDAVNGMNQPYKEALSGKFSNPEAWKRAMQVSFGTTNGHIKNDGTEFYWEPKEYKRIAGTKALPNPDQLEKFGANGQYQVYRYKPKTGQAYDIQQKLQDMGYYDGEVDGKLGPVSQAAVKRYQEDNGLLADGIAGKKTKAKLFAQ